MLRPDGVLLAFFNATEAPPAGTTYTRHVVVDRAQRSQHRPIRRPAASRSRCRTATSSACSSRCAITEQFLLKTNMREVLFRKPALRDPVERDPRLGSPEHRRVART